MTGARDFDLLVIAPGHPEAWDGEPQTYETPYGIARARLRPLGALRAAWVAAGESPFAAIYAAKAAFAARVIELAPVVACNRLLEPDDLLLPDDLVDRTRHPRYTFFAVKGYGFLAQREPFCPTLRGALLAAGQRYTWRVFARGVYLSTEEPSAIEAGALWDADVAGSGVVPASFLARELELCYTPLCVVGELPALTPSADPVAMGEGSQLPLADVLADALRSLPAERVCVCATAMEQYRARGDIGPDWRTWVAV
jgi:5'-methylthioadenosine phosphorylase